jgi:hypothetical protein
MMYWIVWHQCDCMDSYVTNKPWGGLWVNKQEKGKVDLELLGPSAPMDQQTLSSKQ